MRYLLTAAQMKETEQKAIREYGLDSLVLMERAALSVCDIIDDETGLRKEETSFHRPNVLICCGSGNNGADGAAVARILLERGFSPQIWLVGDPGKLTPEMRKQYSIVHGMGIPIITKEPDCEYIIVIDALLGIGARKPLKPEYDRAVSVLNKKNGLKVAIDLPTGLDADTGQVSQNTFRADLTVTFSYEKPGLLLNPGRTYCGRVFCARIGLMDSMLPADAAIFHYEEKDISKLIPGRNPDGNKSTFGKAAIYAGSHTIGGAAVLCTGACYQTGAGYVKVLTPEENRNLVCGSIPETLMVTYREFPAEEQFHDFISFAQVLLAGPGIGTGEDSRQILRWLLSTEKIAQIPVVLDADALNLLADSTELMTLLQNRKLPAILTPHILEFSRLCQCPVELVKKQKMAYAAQYAKDNNCIMVLKDSVTVVAAPDGQCFLNTSGNDGMAKAGSGDVLAGIITSLLAQKLSAFQAACLGVYLHGAAGNQAKNIYGRYTMMPTDMITELSKKMRSE